MRISAIFRFSVLLALAASFGCGGSSDGGIRNDRLYILYWDDVNQVNVLATIDANLPANVSPIGDFNFGDDFVFGLDQRPSNGGLYAYSQLDAGSTDSLIRINSSNATPTLVGSNSINAEIPIGMDFNPVVDVLRVVNRSDLNARVSPTNGSLVAQDTNLSPNCEITDVAYTNNFDGATLTTLYGIDAEGDELVRIGGVDGSPSPNGGVVTSIGPLGVDIDPEFDGAHLDIDENGNAYLLLSRWNGLFYDNELYLVNLTTGAATFIGAINTEFEIAGMTARN